MIKFYVPLEMWFIIQLLEYIKCIGIKLLIVCIVLCCATGFIIYKVASRLLVLI